MSKAGTKEKTQIKVEVYDQTGTNLGPKRDEKRYWTFSDT